MNKDPNDVALSDEDMDEILRLLFQMDEKEQCTDDIRERLWNKVQQYMDSSPVHKPE